MVYMIAGLMMKPNDDGCGVYDGFEMGGGRKRRRMSVCFFFFCLSVCLCL